MERRDMTEYITPPKKFLRYVGRAIADFEMIKDGDRILMGLSGGKDSMAMLHTLIHFQRYAPINFELGVATVDPMVDEYDLSSLVDYVAGLDIPYFVEKFSIFEQAKISMKNDSYCSFCSRIRRGMLYSAARREGYNVLALGQHLDDLAESFLMSAFYTGKLETMKAHYVNDVGDLRVIRPFVYIRERQITDFSNAAQLPLVVDNCPGAVSQKQRPYMKGLLAREEKVNPNMFLSLRNALKPLMGDTNYARAARSRDDV